MQLLTFTLTGMDYGISLENVESIESKMNVVVVPTSPANIRGIIRLHGEILPVFSLASRFGLGNIAVDNLVVVNVGGMKLALEVNDVASCQKELIVMLDVKSLVSQEEQAAIRKMISDNTSDK